MRIDLGVDYQPPPDVVLEVADAHELRSIAYSRQGDLSLYTPSNLTARAANREHPAVIAALDAYWSAAASLDSISGDDAQAVGAYKLGRERYVDILTRLGVALYHEYKISGDSPPSNGVEADARDGAEAEWAFCAECKAGQRGRSGELTWRH